MRKLYLFAFLSTLICLSFAVTSPCMAQCGICGDVTGDGTVNICDLNGLCGPRGLVDYIFRYETSGDMNCHEQGDIDSLPGITMNDVMTMISYLFVLGKLYECPSPVDTVPPAYDTDTLFVMYNDIPVGDTATTWTIKIMEKSSTPVVGLTVPLSYSCAGLDIVLDTVILDKSRYYIYYPIGDLGSISRPEENKVMIYRRGTENFSPADPSEGVFAALKFSLSGSGGGHSIVLDTTQFIPENCLIYSTYNGMAVLGFQPHFVQAPCCYGYRGNVNCSIDEEPDISDITRLIDHLYGSKYLLCCPDEADVNGSGGEPDISDITRLIDFLYLTHTAIVNCP